ncbi:MAG: hypothetical protein WBP93_18305 [Pyrinomonadaceae bacterium]
MKITVKHALMCVAALTLAALFVGPCAAQQQSTSDPRRRPDPAIATHEVERELEGERRLRNSDIKATQPALSMDQRMIFAQISEDFLRIQVVNSDLAQAVSRGGALDLKFVAKSTSEIRKRAERLKYNLALPESEERVKRAKIEIGEAPEQLRAAIESLGPMIAEFAHNPVFKQVNVVDARQAAKVRSDLEAIIDLSGQVKKRSEQLHKAEQKSQ